MIQSPPDFDLKKIGARMPRPRHQNGWLESARGRWIGHWDVYVRLEDGKEVRRDRERVLGLKSEMTKHQARLKLAEIISQDPAAEVAKPDPQVTLEWFYVHRFKPLASANWRRSSRKTFLNIIEKHILTRFGRVRLCDLEPFSLQNHVNRIAETHSRSMVMHVRTMTRMLLGMAVDLEYLPKNPSARLSLPKKLRKPTNRILSLEEIDRLDRGLTGRERLIFRMLVLLGLRPGELFARRWKDWQGDKMIISDALFEGKIDEPKTERSKGFVWLPTLIQRELAVYQANIGSWHDSEAFIFSPRHGKTSRPLDTHNYLRRILKPVCDFLGVEGVTHQCLRRTCSTYMLPHGTVKDVQSHLRHSSAKTTLDIYTKEIPESVKRAVEEMSRAMFPNQLDEEAKGRVN